MAATARHIPGLALVVGCGPNGQSALHPSGPAAASIADLWWLMLAGSAIVLVLVLATLVRALTHRGPRTEPHSRGDTRRATRWIVAGGVVLPVLVLVPLLVVTLKTLAALSSPRDNAVPEIAITGFQWWWDVEYTGGSPQNRLRVANELHIPVGRPVRVRLISNDVIHSFWVPALQGKMDLVPGKVNGTWIQADSAGIYRGICAEYCGLQHARMQFRVIAVPAAEYAAWFESQLRPAAAPVDSLGREGQAVFMRSGCAICHAVRGTAARAASGPDLTHVASRRTLAAGTLPNTPGHLAGWVGNPQGIKPGTLMPRVPLRPEELRALLAYLGTLR